MAYPPPPYADAICGEFVCGEAISGTLWAYPTPAELDLGGTPPTIVIVASEGVPAAALLLGAYAPGISAFVTVTPAALEVGTYESALAITSTLDVAAAEFLLGAYLADFIGVEWILPLACRDLDLGLATIFEQDLAASACTDLVLEPAGER